MSATKVRLLDQETLDGLDEMLPRLHITGKLAQGLVRNARWAAKAHALGTRVHQLWERIAKSHDRASYEACNSEYDALRAELPTLLAEIASPGGTTDE